MEITEESIRRDERQEQKGYLAFAGLIFLVVVLYAVTSSWVGYYKVLFAVAAVAYFVGYCKCYPVFYESMMKDHCMRHSANYRMTDGHYLAMMFSFIWPILWLGRVIIRSFKGRATA